MTVRQVTIQDVALAAGVSRQTVSNVLNGSGRVGEAIQINIRGISSISASTQPLYVVDGLPVTDWQNNLTPKFKGVKIALENHGGVDFLARELRSLVSAR